MGWFTKNQFLPFLKARIEAMRGGAALSKGQRYSVSYVTRCAKLSRIIAAYAPEVLSEKIDEDWMNAFAAYLSAQNIRKNTVAAHLKDMKVNLRRHCKTARIHFAARDFRYSTETTSKIYTSVAEIEKIIALDLSAQKGLEAIRDAYVVQCYTGLRFGDLRRLLNSPKISLVSEKYFKVYTHKTQQVVVIPISEKIMSIMERRGWRFPAFSIQLFNRRIKEIAALAGITQLVEINFTKGGQKVKEVKPANELTSSHTARRSFATNAFLAGIPTLKIRKITGHSTEQSFLIYIRADEMQSAETVLNHPFFG